MFLERSAVARVVAMDRLGCRSEPILLPAHGIDAELSLERMEELTDAMSGFGSVVRLPEEPRHAGSAQATRVVCIHERDERRLVRRQPDVMVSAREPRASEKRELDVGFFGHVLPPMAARLRVETADARGEW